MPISRVDRFARIEGQRIAREMQNAQVSLHTTTTATAKPPAKRIPNYTRDRSISEGYYLNNGATVVAESIGISPSYAGNLERYL